MYSGMMPICIGTIMVATQNAEQEVRAAEAQLGEGESGQRAERDGAERDARRTTISELIRPLFSGASLQRLAACCVNRTPLGRNGGTFAAISAFVCEAITIV